MPNISQSSTGRNGAPLESRRCHMTDAWKQQEGQLVDGRFRLIQYLGGTDHSAVFLTEFGDKRQRFAIKLIGADPADADTQLARLRRAAKLSHPHLARIFQCGRAQVGNASVLYLVTEYAEEDLAQILPDRALRPDEVREMLPQILDALQYLHSQGFVHARLKPSNILAVEEQLKLSIDGVCAPGERGSPGEKPSPYDPPELAPTGPSPTGDVWSLGMTIVEVLTQRLPVWEWTGHADPPAPRTLPAPFLEITRNCLRRDPAMRCTIREILENLDPPVASRIAPSSTKIVSDLPSATPVRPKPVAMPQAEWTPSSNALPHKSKSRYAVQAVAFVLALAAVIAIPRFFRHAPKSLDSDPVSAAAPAGDNSKSEPAAEPVATTKAPPLTAPKPAPKANEPRTAVKKPVLPAPVATAAPITTPPKSAGHANSPAPAAVRGQVVHQALPDVSQKARNTIHGKVRVSVRVTVDPSGKVAEASFEAPGPSKYFADAALRAAKNWTFAPAKANGNNVASQWLLRFEFDNSATSTFSAEINP
ncbi:MAG: TonB family protein [Candidatus Acidiferrales bacterium]